MQLPDDHHRAKELRDTDFTTFRQMADAAMTDNSSTIPLPSNLLFMYQAVKCVPEYFILDILVGMSSVAALFWIKISCLPSHNAVCYP